MSFLRTMSLYVVYELNINTLKSWNKDFINIHLMVREIFMFESTLIKISNGCPDFSTCHYCIADILLTQA